MVVCCLLKFSFIDFLFPSNVHAPPPNAAVVCIYHTTAGSKRIAGIPFYKTCLKCDYAPGFSKAIRPIFPTAKNWPAGPFPARGLLCFISHILLKACVQRRNRAVNGGGIDQPDAIRDNQKPRYAVQRQKARGHDNCQNQQRAQFPKCKAQKPKRKNSGGHSRFKTSCTA